MIESTEIMDDIKELITNEHCIYDYPTDEILFCYQVNITKVSSKVKIESIKIEFTKD